LEIEPAPVAGLVLPAYQQEGGNLLGFGHLAILSFGYFKPEPSPLKWRAVFLLTLRLCVLVVNRSLDFNMAK
jgi:hypothetical protein